MKSSKKTPAKKIIKKVPQKTAPAAAPQNETREPVVPKAPAFKVQPLADRVIIKEDTESKELTTVSGIIIPVSAQEDKGSKRGKVVAAGNGKVEDGKTIALTVKPGDIVLFQWGDKIRVDNEDYYIVRESEILAVIN